jgi:hypothetical protein
LPPKRRLQDLTTSLSAFKVKNDRPNTCPESAYYNEAQIIRTDDMMAVTLRQLIASTSSILIWGSVWGFPSIIEISLRKFKIRLISEVLVNSV